MQAIGRIQNASNTHDQSIQYNEAQNPKGAWEDDKHKKDFKKKNPIKLILILVFCSKRKNPRCIFKFRPPAHRSCQKKTIKCREKPFCLIKIEISSNQKQKKELLISRPSDNKDIYTQKRKRKNWVTRINCKQTFFSLAR